MAPGCSPRRNVPLLLPAAAGEPASVADLLANPLPVGSKAYRAGVAGLGYWVLLRVRQLAARSESAKTAAQELQASQAKLQRSQEEEQSCSWPALHSPPPDCLAASPGFL